MKFRDVVLLLVGGGLVVVGMLMSNLIENDAIADSHSNEAVEYEYKIAQKEHSNTYDTYYRGNREKIKLDKSEKYYFGSSAFKNRVGGTGLLWNRILDTEAVDGWVLDIVTDDSASTFIFKRVKQ